MRLPRGRGFRREGCVDFVLRAATEIFEIALHSCVLPVGRADYAGKHEQRVRRFDRKWKAGCMLPMQKGWGTLLPIPSPRAPLAGG
jgi:hypothetical protein